jgi:hypothetical protein
MLKRIQRLLKHRWMSDADRIFGSDALSRLIGAIATSELQHSGEIRVCIESGLPNGYLLRSDDISMLTRQRALNQFAQLRVWDTAENNGVLIYLLLAEHRIELVADRGLNPVCSTADWDAISMRLAEHLREGHIEEGLVHAISEVAALLKTHFPLAKGSDNTNELPDRPVLL